MACAVRSADNGSVWQFIISAKLWFLWTVSRWDLSILLWVVSSSPNSSQTRSFFPLWSSYGDVSISNFSAEHSPLAHLFDERGQSIHNFLESPLLCSRFCTVCRYVVPREVWSNINLIKFVEGYYIHRRTWIYARRLLNLGWIVQHKLE